MIDVTNIEWIDTQIRLPLQDESVCIKAECGLLLCEYRDKKFIANVNEVLICFSSEEIDGWINENYISW